MRQFGKSVGIDEQRREFDALLNTEASLRSVAESIPHLFWMSPPDGSIEYVNQRWLDYTGLTREQALAGWREAIHPDDRKLAIDKWKIALATGDNYEAQFRLRRAEDGNFRWQLARAIASKTDAGKVRRWFGTITDIDEQKRAEVSLRFFAEAGEALAESLDLQTTLDQLLGLVVPALADWAAIDLLEDDDRLRTVAVVHADPRKAALIEPLRNAYTHDPDHERAVSAALRARKSRIIERISDEMIAQAAAPALLPVIRALQPRSTVSIPLRSHGKTLGSLVAYWAQTPRSYGTEDLPLFEELAKRAAVAIENAQLYEREHHVASTFQRAALPISLPSVPGLVFDGVYQPARNGDRVGGDWYDALRLADGRIVISIGDVAGSGLGAAVTMAAMRQAIRTVAQIYPDPVTILDAADKTLKAETPDGIVTAFVGVFDPITLALSYASAGHPPPILRSSDGTLTELTAASGLPLGLRLRHESAQASVIDVREGALVVFYTDGLIEATRDIIAGSARLQQVLSNADIVPDRHVARSIFRGVLGGDDHDDVAILTLQVEGTDYRESGEHDAGLRRWSFDASDAEAARAARSAFVAALDAGGVLTEDLFTAELVFGELLSNVVRYAPGPLEVIFDWSGPLPVLHVLDRGAGFLLVPRLPSDLLSERGRGLFIVWSITEECNVTRRPSGGAHARAVLSVGQIRSRQSPLPVRAVAR